MKILYFSDNTSGHNQRFLEKLAGAGLDVWFLDPTAERQPGWLPPGIHWAQAKNKLPRDPGPARFEEFLPEFKGWLNKIEPDVIHAGPTHNCGYLTALTNFHPWLLMPWGSDILFQAQRNPDCRRATQISLSSADAFFFDCDAVRDQAERLADVPASRVIQFPWGIKKGSFTPAGALPAQEKFVREPGTHVFICTRSWEPLYGIETLLQAFQEAYCKNQSLRLLLLGNGSEANIIQEFIDAHGLSVAIRLVGHVGKAEMPKWFRAADTYVSSAQTDGTSISLLEAMASGLPVVVTDIPSNREWVTEDHNGWLAPACSSEEFADRLLRAARLDQQERALFSQRNQILVKERADWDRNFPRLLEMYRQLVAVSVGR